MADTPSAGEGNPSQPQQQKGIGTLMNHISVHKVDVGLWATRLLTVIFALFGYFLPLLNGVLGDPQACYYKALMASAATSALRLHQRLPRVQLTREFAATLMLEDSAHYLFYAVIFLYASAPITMALLPVLLFGVLHSASYSLTLLDAMGAPTSWWGARFLISLVELQSRNILRMVAFSEIFLMPLTVVYVFSGRTWLVAPLVYFRFLGLRYASRRNPYTRAVFYELRVAVEQTANHPKMPQAVGVLVQKAISVMSNMAPALATPHTP
jgi:hypothetical protein